MQPISGQMFKKILLTGATGFLGSRTLERLVSDPQIEEIIATGRTLKPGAQVVHDKIRYTLGDLSNPQFTETISDGVEVIVHAAALSSPWGRYAEFEKANVLSQKNLIAAAKKNGAKRFVYISTPSMYFEMRERLNVKESDPLPEKFINAYAETKRKAELLLEESGIPFVILRPRALIGRGDTVIMPRLIRAFQEGRLKVIGNGRNIADLTSVSNVADAILLSIRAEQKALNGTYNISNGEPVVLWEAIAEVLAALGYELPKGKVPLGIALFAARIMETKAKLTGMKEPSLTRYGVGTLTQSLTMDITAARERLGYVPNMNTREAIAEFVKWYKENENG